MDIPRWVRCSLSSLADAATWKHLNQIPSVRHHRNINDHGWSWTTNHGNDSTLFPKHSWIETKLTQYHVSKTNVYCLQCPKLQAPAGESPFYRAKCLFNHYAAVRWLRLQYLHYAMSEFVPVSSSSKQRVIIRLSSAGVPEEYIGDENVRSSTGKAGQRRLYHNYGIRVEPIS